MGVSAHRFKLSQSYCPTADASEKELLACKNYEISKAIRATSDDAEKKAAGAAHKVFFSKAYGKYCGASDKNAASEVCTNSTMKTMYGGATAIGARKAKKQKL